MPKEFILTLIVYTSIGCGIATIIGGIVGGIASASWILFLALALLGALSIATGSAISSNAGVILDHWRKK